MNKVFVTGRGNGLVGSRMAKLGASALMSDVTDAVKLDTEINNVRPSVIVHLASKSGVDYCERAENQKIGNATNFMGAVNVFELAEKYNIPVVHISSDHIFGGNWWGNYRENSMDFKPKNQYGLQKLVAEAAALEFRNVKIVRTSTLIHRKHASISYQLHSLEQGEKTVSSLFMWRSFMHVDHFVSSIMYYLNNLHDMPKILHISGSKNISWQKLIKSYAKVLSYDVTKVVGRNPSLVIPGEANRPLRCGLSTHLSKTLGFPQYDYLDAIKQDKL